MLCFPNRNLLLLLTTIKSSSVANQNSNWSYARVRILFSFCYMNCGHIPCDNVNDKNSSFIPQTTVTHDHYTWREKWSLRWSTHCPTSSALWYFKWWKLIAWPAGVSLKWPFCFDSKQTASSLTTEISLLHITENCIIVILTDLQNVVFIFKGLLFSY